MAREQWADADDWYARGAVHAADGGDAWLRLGELRLQRAALAAEADASRQLVLGMAREHYSAAADAFESSARAGNAHGAYNLGRLYEWRQVSTVVRRRLDDKPSSHSEETPAQGADGGGSDVVVAADEQSASQMARSKWRDEAIYWYSAAADGGLAVARACLARLISERGSAADRRIACTHYTVAAKGGDADSAFELATMHRLGRGCERDEQIAQQWMSVAAELGHPRAQAERG